MGRLNIERFSLWRVKEKELLSLKFIFGQVNRYFGKEPMELDSQKSFKDTIYQWAKKSQLVPMPLPLGIIEPCYNVPIIARDKKHDQAVVLIPQAEGFLVKNESKSYYLKANKVLTDFDEHVLLFPALHGFHKKQFFEVKALGLAILFLFSWLFFTLALLAVIFSQFQYTYLVASLFSLSLAILFYQMGQRLAVKNYGLNLFSRIYQYFDSLLSLPGELFLDQVTKANSITKGIKTLVKEHFFNRSEFILSLIVIISSLFLILWLPSMGPFLFLAGLLMSVFFWRLKVLEEKYLPKVFKAQTDVEQTLEQYKIAFSTISLLKAFDGISARLFRQKEILSSFKQNLLIIRFLKKSARFYGPLAFYLFFSCWRAFFGVNLLLWQAMFLSVAMLFLGLFFAIACENLFKIREWTPYIAPKILGTHVEPVNIQGSFELINMSFSYPAAGFLVFKNFNFKLEANKFYGICGPSGCGKSTLLKILLGFLRPDGQVVIDGQDLRSLDLSAFRKHLGVIFDDSTLFMGSVYENILCGRDLRPKNLERLLIHPIFDTLLDMPMGLESFIFWHQKNLTHYEKALILLARALVHRPQVLIMDEFINNLSSINQEKITDFLSELSITRVLVSNNPHVLAKTEMLKIG